jgi:hypothetical protein
VVSLLKLVTPKTKSESTSEFIQELDTLERQSDTCYQGLRLLDHEWNFAAWLSLTECIRRLESELQPRDYGTGKHQVAAMNLARAAAQMCKFSRDYGEQSLRAPSGFRWSPQVAAECATAFNVAWSYSMFCVDFPAWHANLYSAELLGPKTIRFHSGTSALARRVMAYQKGIRPISSAAHKEQDNLTPSTEKLRALFDEVVRSSKKSGQYRISIGPIDRLRGELIITYADRLSSIFRRYPSISVGDYTLEQFRNFYAALLTIVGAHEHLCFLWSRLHGHPVACLTLVSPRTKWVRLLSHYTGQSATITEAILGDLIFGESRGQDLQMLPFVPLASDKSLLAVAPAFPLQSNWEENILRVCSFSRPKIYSASSVLKEDEMREHLKTAASPSRVLAGPVKIKGIPDLDLVVEDVTSNALILAELKWPRKPYSPRETRERNSEIKKGVAQIKAIKSFLTANPTFLADRQYAKKPLSGYDHIQFCVVSRDHLIETEEADYPIYGYDAFKRAITAPGQIADGLALLNSMNWLPREGEDFKIDWLHNTAAGVTVVSELFLLTEATQSIITYG